MRTSLTLFVALAVLSGCDPTELTVDGGPGADATTGPAGRITVESPTTVTLTYGERAELRVRYLEGETPRAGIELGLALSGTANDTDLSEDYIVTGLDGRAVAALVAGSVRSAFRLRINAERAAPAYVDVSVGDAGFGGLRVRAVYTGARAETTRRVLRVYSEVGCDPPGGYPSTAVARQVSLDDPAETQVTFTTLPVGLSYTVVGTVEGSTGVTLASACVDRVALTADEISPIDLSFADARLVPDGRYSLTVSVASDAFSEITARAQDAALASPATDAESYLTALELQLRRRGLTADADALALERTSGDAVASLRTELAAIGADPAAALRGFFLSLLAHFGDLEIAGTLDLAVDGDSVSASWAHGEARLLAPPAPDRPPPLDLDPSAAGLEGDLTLALDWRPERDLFVVRALDLAAPVTTVVSAAIDAAAGAPRSGPGEALREAAGCAALSAWIAGRSSLASICDAGCADAVCASAWAAPLDAAGAAALAEPSADRITLRGELAVVDDDGDLVVDRLTGELVGRWSNDAGTPSADATGRVSAARAEPPE